MDRSTTAGYFKILLSPRQIHLLNSHDILKFSEVTPNDIFAPALLYNTDSLSEAAGRIRLLQSGMDLFS